MNFLITEKNDEALELITDRNCQIAVLGRNLVIHIKNTKVIADGNRHFLVEFQTSTQAQTKIKTLVSPLVTKDVYAIGLTKQTDAKIRTKFSEQSKILIYCILVTGMNRDIKIKRI